MAINSRAALTAYALRALGDDVIEINVSDDQASDRLDEALGWFQDYHSDGIEKLWFKHQVTNSTIAVSDGQAMNFVVGETILAATSGASFITLSTNSPNIINTRLIGATLVPGETLTGQTSGTVSSVSTAPNSVVIGDIENRYIPLTDAIISVVNVLPINQEYSGANFNMFDVRYQIMLNDMFSLTNINMLYYTQVLTHISMINFFLTPAISFEYNRHQNQLALNLDWDQKVNPNDWIVVEAYAILDPDTWTDVYNDRWLKAYYIALLKKQWGNNLKKFGGMQLPGGVIMNGQQIYDEAIAEIADLSHRVMYDQQLPVDFLVG